MTITDRDLQVDVRTFHNGRHRNADGPDAFPPPCGPDDHRQAAVPAPLPRMLAIHRASDFAGQAVPDRPWLVPGLIPRRTVTYLTGDGGGGKSLLMKQLAVAVATGSTWLGTKPERGPALYLTAEDEEAEVHRRLVDIVAASDALALADLDDMHVLSLAGQDALLAVPDRKTGTMVPTELWRRLVLRVADLAPRLVVLDTAADLFGGNEISRSEVRSFIGMLRGLAQAQDAAVVLVGHPSVAGMASGTGLSGSTAWNNSVRCRLYLDRIKGDADPDLRTLKVAKANYGPIGAEMRLRWQAGVFRRESGDGGGHHRVTVQVDAERVFIELLTTFVERGREVSDKPSVSYAPAVFAETVKGAAIGKRALMSAMERLFRASRIRAEAYGPPSKRRSKIVVA